MRVCGASPRPLLFFLSGSALGVDDTSGEVPSFGKESRGGEEAEDGGRRERGEGAAAK